MPRYTLEIIVLALLALWLFGAFIAPIGDDLIHLLLFAVIAIIVARLIQIGRVLY